MKLDPLDRLYSESIRKRAIQRVGGCERCLSQKFDIQKDNGQIYPAWKQLQCSHFKGRTAKSVRWDEDNAAGLCGGCHMHLEHQPDEHTEWFRSHLGEEAFDLLLARARVPQKPDINAITLYLQERLRGME